MSRSSSQPTGRHRLLNILAGITFVTAGLAALVSSAAPAAAADAPSAVQAGKLQPAALGQGMCQARAFADKSVQAQLAVYDTTCSVATGILGPAADKAHGTAFHSDGFTCAATAAGKGSPWASAWGGTYYIYNCTAGKAQAAFNWGRDYVYGGYSSGGSGGSTASGGTHTFNKAGKLQPSALGYGMCQAQAFADKSVQAQLAVYDTTCSVATGILGPAADKAHGTAFHSDGFTCAATAAGKGSPWASAWGGTYYIYNCTAGKAQAAFNWGRDYTY